MAARTIPVIDFTAYGLQRESPQEEFFQKLIDDLHSAFKTIGFLYLTNHGIPQTLIDNAFKHSSMFFSLPFETKNKYRKMKNSHHGYIEDGGEATNPSRPGDYKDCFNHVPMFCIGNPRVSLYIFDVCMELSNRLFEVMARGLELEDPLLFVNAHKGIKGPDNTTTLRTLYYPPISQGIELEPNQILCGEHSDYGAMTLLFQDNIRGLEYNIFCQHVTSPLGSLFGFVLDSVLCFLLYFGFIDFYQLILIFVSSYKAELSVLRKCLFFRG
ncbi:uncharacterized protein LOC144362822 [Saccoglossus kowalevskii]